MTSGPETPNAIGQDLAPDVGAPAIGPTSSAHSRISRSGSWLIVSGILLIGIAVILIAVDYQILISSGPTDTFQQVNLIGAIDGLFAALGVVLVATGWTLDQRAILALLGSGRPGKQHRTLLAGMVIVLVGASIIVGVELFGFYIDYAAYLHIPVAVNFDVYIYEYVILGVGAILTGIGWFLHHLGALENIESSVPHPGGLCGSIRDGTAQARASGSE